MLTQFKILSLPFFCYFALLFLSTTPKYILSSEVLLDKNDTAPKPSIKLGILTIVRDQSAIILNNLKQWEEILTCIVVGIDDRTKDDSYGAVVDSFPQISFLKRAIFFFEFDGMGKARTELLRVAWHRFPPPEMTHCLIINADWKPISPLPQLLPLLDFDHHVFQYPVYVGQEITPRYLNWCFQHSPDVWVKYQYHEEITFPGDVQLLQKKIDWAVAAEVDPYINQNMLQTHGTDSLYNRYLGLLTLLMEEFKEHPEDPHTLFYIGETHLQAARIEKDWGNTEGFEHHFINAKYNFEQVIVKGIDGPTFSKKFDLSWAAMLNTGLIYEELLEKYETAAQWYQDAIAFARNRAEGYSLLSGVLLRQGKLQAAIENVNGAVSAEFFNGSHFPSFDNAYCATLMNGARAAALEFIQAKKEAQVHRPSLFYNSNYWQGKSWWEQVLHLRCNMESIHDSKKLIAALNQIFEMPLDLDQEVDAAVFHEYEIDHEKVKSQPRAETPSGIIDEVIVCEGETFEITCDGINQKLKIHDANFGRYSQQHCPHQFDSNTSCFSVGSKDKLVEQCDGMSNCLLFADISVFGDPCYLTFKYLYVKYECITKNGEMLKSYI